MVRFLQVICLAFALSVGSGRLAAEPPHARITVASYEWDWDGFKRYWSNHLGRTTGVVGIVVMVVGVGVLIILSARKRT
jgi:hypothetical protein